MKFFFTMLLAAFFCVGAAFDVDAASYKKQKSKFGENLLETGFVYKYSIPDVTRDKLNDNVLYMGGKHKWSWLDLNWEINLSNALKIPDLSDFFSSSYNYMYGKVNPSISIAALMDKKTLIPLIKDVLIAYRFDFDNNKGDNRGLFIHNMGLGVALDMPVFDYVRVNFYARYPEKNYNRVTYQFDGWLFNAELGLTMYEFGKTGMKLSYHSWLDWVFEARTSPNNSYETPDSLQWNNQFRIDYKLVYIAYTYQVNYHYMQQKRNASESHMQSAGIYFYINF